MVSGPPCSVSGADGYHEPQQVPGSSACTVGTWHLTSVSGPYCLSVCWVIVNVSLQSRWPGQGELPRIVGWSRFPLRWPKSEFSQAYVCLICNCQPLAPQPEGSEVDTEPPRWEGQMSWEADSLASASALLLTLGEAPRSNAHEALPGSLFPG